MNRASRRASDVPIVRRQVMVRNPVCDPWFEAHTPKPLPSAGHVARLVVEKNISLDEAKSLAALPDEPATEDVSA